MSRALQYLTHPDGRSMPLIYWAIEFDVTPRCLRDRIKRGFEWWHPRRNFANLPLTQPITGEVLTGQQWADRLCIRPNSLRQRVNRFKRDPETSSAWWAEDLSPGPKPRQYPPNPDQLELFTDDELQTLCEAK
jgi:hypothetical protein